MTFKGYGLAYIPETGAFVGFKNGTLETDDPVVIRQLIADGFESDGKMPEEEHKATVKKTTKKGQA